MLRYFVAGNAWLAMTLVLKLGQHWERSSPTRYSFFGVGSSFSPAGYEAMVLLCLGLAIAQFGLYAATREAGGGRGAIHRILKRRQEIEV